MALSITALVRMVMIVMVMMMAWKMRGRRDRKKSASGPHLGARQDWGRAQSGKKTRKVFLSAPEAAWTDHSGPDSSGDGPGGTTRAVP